MATTKKKATSKEKAVAKKVLQAARRIVCKPMTCKITDPLCGKLTTCKITCKITK